VCRRVIARPAASRARRHHASVLSRRPDVLVLGGGGVLGEAWLRSCLAGIEAESGWDLGGCDAFVGTSAGSIVAAVFAAGRRPEAARGVAEAWERAAADGSPDRRRGIGSLARRAALGAVAPFAPAVVAGLEPAGAAVRAALLRWGRRATREIPDLRAAIERMESTFDGRLRITAVDVRSGRRVIFGAPAAPEASVTDAVLASCAVPWVFRPVTIGGREYVDGGFWSAANLDVAPVERGDEVLCLVPTASPRLAIDRLGAMRAFANTTAAAESLVLRRRGARVRIVAPDAATVEAIGPNLFDRRRREQVEAAGYAQGRALASRP
jgi:NTE family protein